VIRAQGLTKRFRARRGEVTAVEHVDLEVAAGEFVGFVGPNGAGKSTTIKMLCGVLLPSSGDLRVHGLVPSRQRRELTRHMGVLFGQRSSLWWDLPLRESFRLVGRLYRLSDADAARRLGELTEVLDLGPLLDVPVRSLSLGQRMRGELAAAVLPRPGVLFLDEPTIGLDVEAKAAVRSFLATINREHGTTILLTTHDLGDIAQLCPRMVIIDKGRKIYDGSVAALKESYAAGRAVVVDVADRGEVQVAGAVVTRREGRRHWLLVPRDQRVPDVVARLLADHDVEDLVLEEPDIEDIIRRIYREGTVVPSPLPDV
jgi:ABC-2 type transport system ATP-binding protein